MRKNLSRQMIVRGLISFVIPLTIVWGLVYVTQKEAFELDALKDNVRMTANIRNQLEESLYRTLQIATIVGHAAESDSPDLEAIIETVNIRDEELELIELLDLQGRVLDAYPMEGAMIGADHSALTDLSALETLGDVSWSSTYTSPRSGKPAITLSVRLHDHVVISYLNIDHISKIATTLFENEQGKLHLSIVDSKGLYVSHEDLLFVEQRRHLAAFDMILEDYRTKNTMGTVIHDGLESYVSVAYMPGPEWYVIGFMPVESIEASVRSINVIFLIILVIILMLVAFYATNMIFTLKAAIRLFQEKTKQVVSGTFIALEKHEIPVEFHDLLDDFDAMHTKIKSRDLELMEMAYTDRLTRLRNNLFLHDHLEDLIQQSGKDAFSLILIDLDHFERVNNIFGQQTGDAALMALAQRLQGNLKAKEMTGRLWGDKFMVILEEMNDRSEILARARELKAMMSEPLNIGENEINLDVSLSIILYPEHGGEAGQLIQHAEIAMQQAKTDSSDGIFLFNEVISRRIQRGLLMESELDQAVALEELYLVFQPQVDVSSSRIRGVEALLRWRNPLLGDISPSEFIPLAERTGRIHEIGKWVIIKALENFESLKGAGGEDLLISINVSPVQLQQGGFAEEAVALARASGVPLGQLEFEITEESIINKVDEVIQNFQIFKEAGIRLAMDDFGKGYSSLNYLNEFEVDTIKIDRSLIREIEQSPKKRIVLNSLYDIARQLEADMVVEGVETEAQHEIVRKLGPVLIQGYYYSQPLGLEAAVDFIRRRRS